MTSKPSSLENLLETYQQQIVKSIQENMESLGPRTKLREACEYALMNGGKRMRPAIVLMVAKALDYGADATQAALCIEYFHTASLVADDLPCMDDDDLRRSKPSVHKKYGEAIAMLVSYALIAGGYACLARNAQVLKEAGLMVSSQSDKICVLALENATYNTGLSGATGGQFMDIFPPDLTMQTLREVIHKKTVSLFEVSFVSGWLFGGGDPAKLSLVKKAASHFGIAFQVADDIDDVEQDIQNERLVNVAARFGLKEAQKIVREEIKFYKQTLEDLNLSLPELVSLPDLFKC